MIKRFSFRFVAVLIIVLFCRPLWGAKEDTAQITLKKTAVSKKNFHLYTVKQGDVISAIIRRLPGITEDDIPDNYRIVKQLNPEVPNFNILYTGQVIKLPGKINIQSKEESEGKPSISKAIPAGTYTYKIKKGDSLISIINHKLNIKTDTRQALRLIKSLNPRITDINRIYIGKVILLPGKQADVQLATSDSAKNIQQVEENQAQINQAENIIDKKEMKVMPREAKLAVVKHVVTQMNATFMTSGNYYLPIKNGQITIDCRKIPVIEFDDKTTIFLDWENRLHESLKKMIRDNWKSFSIVKVNKKDDIIVILRKIFASTKSCTINKRDTSVIAGTNPQMELMVDWLIIKSDSRQRRPLMQGLRFVQGNNSLLPKAIKNYTRQNGLIITEIDKETGLAGKPEEIYSLRPMAILPTASAKEFAYSLVTNLGYIAKKDADIKIFNMAKDGFNLSVNVDLLIKNADKKYILYSNNLPSQFINILKKEHYQLISVANSDAPKILIEKILPALAIPSTYGYFTFSGADKNQAPYTFGFTGMKIKAGKDLYIINFAIDDGLRGLIAELWSADIARY